MKLTPLDIKKQEFTRSFRGVDAQEVQSFLHMVAEQWDSLLDENRRHEQRVKELDSKLEHYRKIEEALQEALETARDNSHKTIENAQREAQIILKEARSAAEEMRKRASTDHKRLKHDISKISSRRDEVIARLRAFLMSEMELLARFEGQDPIGYVRLNSGDHHQLNEPDYYGNSSSGREVHVNSSYNRTGTGQYVQDDPPVNLPVDEEEVPFEEESLEAEAFFGSDGASSKDDEAQFEFGVADNSIEHTPSSSEGLSTDELEFIKSTVTSATKGVAVEDIFKPAEPTEPKERLWQNGNGQNENNPAPKPPAEHAKPSPTSNPFFAKDEPPQPDNGWTVRPAPQQKAPPPPGNPNRQGGFSSPLFGAESDVDDLSATPEEIEKIRRILNDLD